MARLPLTSLHICPSIQIEDVSKVGQREGTPREGDEPCAIMERRDPGTHTRTVKHTDTRKRGPEHEKAIEGRRTQDYQWGCPLVFCRSKELVQTLTPTQPDLKPLTHRFRR